MALSIIPYEALDTPVIVTAEPASLSADRSVRDDMTSGGGLHVSFETD